MNITVSAGPYASPMYEMGTATECPRKVTGLHSGELRALPQTTFLEHSKISNARLRLDSKRRFSFYQWTT
jgi:hypothetical protein